MNVILRIDGWTKVHTISADSYAWGRVYIALEPPLSYLACPADGDTEVIPDSLPMVTAEFVRTGASFNGMPVFDAVSTLGRN